MSTVFEPLTTQVDGITDTFTTVNNLDSGFLPVYNGQTVNEGDFTKLTSTTFQLTFIPKATPTPKDTLGIFLNPTVFDITPQVDGVKTVFNEDPIDTGTDDFIAILNGQLKVDETVTISSTKFNLSPAPIIGDTLEYIRVFSTKLISVKEDLDGIIDKQDLVGQVDQEPVFGIMKESELIGQMDSSQELEGIVPGQNKITAEIKN